MLDGEDLIRELLTKIDLDPDREGLKETPERVMKAWNEWTSGYLIKPEDILKTFEDGAENYDELILQCNIPFFSHCEHHMAPFFGKVHIGYLARKKIVGLSKLSRLVDVFAKRLQVQERMTTQIANALQENLKPAGVGVIVKARHLCMESRGIAKVGSHTMTSCLTGSLQSSAALRGEFLQLVSMGEHGGA